MNMECNCNLRTKLVGDGCEGCNQELAAQFELYCHQCGSDDLAYVAQYADSKEYRCRDCDGTVTANCRVERLHSFIGEPGSSAMLEM